MTGEAWAVIPAAGSGTRFGDRQDKLTVHLGGVPILVKTVEAVLNARSVAGAVVVANSDRMLMYQRMLTEYGHQKPRIYTEGGRNRRESVLRGLEALPESADVVVIHDAARPLITPAKVDEAVALVRGGQPAVVVAAPIVDTVKQVAAPGSAEIAGTLDRRLLYRAQTPQVFSRDLVEKAHHVVDHGATVTDDAQLVELSGLARPCVLPGHESNLKITTPADLAMAEALLAMGRLGKI